MRSGPTRKRVRAHELKACDFVHDALIGHRVVRFLPAAAGYIRVLATSESGTSLTAQYPAGHLLDVTRLFDDPSHVLARSA